MARKPVTARDALLFAVAENPDDDTPRLVFADWLDEHGDAVDRAWAEYIRLECASAQLPIDSPKRNLLQQRSTYLYQSHAHMGWRDLLPAGFGDWGFHRGFPYCVRTNTLNFVRRGKSLFRRAPVQRLILTSLRGYLDALLASPLLTHLRGLELLHEDLSDDGAAQLAACPHVARLTALRVISSRLTDVGAAALAASPTMTRLTDLQVGGDHVSVALTASIRERIGTKRAA
jgi:uncharacterized protein (TIGR02996 family)